MRQTATSSFEAVCRYRRKSPPAQVFLQAHFDARALIVMPSLSPSSKPFSQRAARLLIAVTALAALVALPRVRAATPPAASATPAAPSVPAKTGKDAKSPTCQTIMQRLSGSLAGTPSNTAKPGTVLVDVDKAGVTMACSHSDAIAIPVPGASNPKAR